MNQYQFRIFNPRKIQDNPQEVELSNQLYQTWAQVFSKVVISAGGKLDPDDYFRNDFALVLYDAEQVIGFSLCTEFDLRLMSSREHHYWKALAPQTLDLLQKDHHINRIMSMEYLTVLPDWRQTRAEQISWAEVVSGLGLLYQDHFAVDGLLGTPRADIRMSAICEGLGGVALQPPILKMNYPCSVHLFPKVQVGARKFANPLTQHWAYELWNQRQDLRINDREQQSQKTAA